jgi:hypothetical protein
MSINLKCWNYSDIHNNLSPSNRDDGDSFKILYFTYFSFDLLFIYLLFMFIFGLKRKQLRRLIKVEMHFRKTIALCLFHLYQIQANLVKLSNNLRVVNGDKV